MTAPLMRCNVCNQPMGEPLYVSAEDRSITSLGVIIPQKTEVFFSRECGHLQTKPLADLERYYDKNYTLLARSEDEDQLYKYEEGKKVFRFDHQADTLFRTIEIPSQALVLDFGCSKAATLKKLAEKRPDIVPHAFDMTDRYCSFWERFIGKGNWSIHVTPTSWEGRFDLITAFFVLEHVKDPRGIAGKISRLLKPGGTFYAIVPNVYVNPADFLVADHINHFSPDSLRRLLTVEGFSVERIDDSLHESGLIVVAQKDDTLKIISDEEGEDGYIKRAADMAAFWRVSSEKIKRFEGEHMGSRSAIYGAGFYGTFIASSLCDFESIACFIDQNPYLQKETRLGKQIFAPERIPDGIDTIYVGLNPRGAKGEIDKIKHWEAKHYNYFFL